MTQEPNLPPVDSPPAWALLLRAGAAAIIVVLGLLVFASLINAVARQLALGNRVTSDTPTQAALGSTNLLVGAVEGTATAGFVALRIDEDEGRAVGLVIPADAFVNVPGRGFSRLGDASVAGMDVIADAVANFLGVGLTQWVVVSPDAYQRGVTAQDVKGLLSEVETTNLPASRLRAILAATQTMSSDQVVLVPLPVKPINLGDSSYLEPQKAAVAEQLRAWWGVDAASELDVVRVAVFNGVGAPGIGGVASQQLIRAGYRVVDTQNADRFDYDTTVIVVKRGNIEDGHAVARVLGCGTVVSEHSAQDVIDIAITIGRDYDPQESDPQDTATPQDKE